MRGNGRSLFMAIAVVLIACAAYPQEEVGFVNLDFEQGKEPWGVWYSDEPNYAGPRFEYGPDTSVARSGKASMRIVATSRDARAFVNQSTDRFKPDALYELSYWIKVSSPEMAKTCTIKINLRKPRQDGKGLEMRSIEPMVLAKPGENGWVHRRSCFSLDPDAKQIQIGLYVRDTVGTAWFDDVQIREMRPGEISVDSMYDYYPLQVKLETDMLRRFQALVTAKSPFLDRAKVYNRLLVAIARVTEDARRAQRCAHYLTGLGKPSDAAEVMALVSDLEGKLDALYQLYGRLFVKKNDAGLPEFDQAATALKAQTEAARAKITERMKSLQAAAQEAGQAWTAPPEPQPKPIVLSGDGRPNQIVIGTRSPTTHFDLEEPLTINKLHSLVVDYSLGEFKDPATKYDFKFVFDSWQKLKDLGAEQATIGTGLALHDNQMTPAWFEEKLKGDPDLLMRAADDAKLKAWRPCHAPLNIWRPEVREMTADLVRQMATTFSGYPEFLAFITAAENIGPYFSVESGVRSIGYNASALPDFHAWLKERYGSVDELNRRWKTTYARIEEIKPPEDLCLVTEWQRPHPLGYEFQTWREDRHIAWQKFIYDAFKKADPKKPVFSSPSCFLRSLDGSRAFDTVDIMGFHAMSPHFMLGSVYIHSMNRFARKNLGQYECFWGCQEEHPRMAEEKVMRCGMMKYLYRLTIWGRYVQVWWYSFTTGNYLLQYNGNWFNPVYDLTTMRYCAPALPVGKAKVKRLEEILLNSEIVPSRIAMLQPNTSMLFQKYARGESYLEMTELHEALFARNDLYELIPETYFLDGRASLDNFDVVIFPYAPFFPDKLSDLLRAWVDKGGLLIAAGPCGLYDKYGFDKPDLWAEAFGGRVPKRLTAAKDTDWRWAFEDKPDGPDFVEGTVGRGKVIAMLRSLVNADFRTSAIPKLAEEIEAKAPPIARCASNDLEMTVHQAKDGRKYLCVINRNVDKAVADRVTLAGEFRRGVDLDAPGGFPVRFEAANGRTSFDLRLEPAEFTMIALEQ